MKKTPFFNVLITTGTVFELLYIAYNQATKKSHTIELKELLILIRAFAPKNIKYTIQEN
jgi:hypothetical protein